MVHGYIVPQLGFTGSKREIQLLHEGVHDDRLRHIQQPLWNRQSLLQQKLTSATLEDHEKETLQGELEDLENRVSEAR